MPSEHRMKTTSSGFIFKFITFCC